MKWLLFAAVIGFAASTTIAAWEVGDTVPELESFGIEGDVPVLKGKITYIDFWASWCAPCKAAFPQINEMYLKYKDKGFQVLAISVDTNKKAMDKFLDRAKPSFVVAHDSGQKLVADTGLEKMPTSFLVDENGVIRYIHEGWSAGKSAAELEGQILGLLGGLEK